MRAMARWAHADLRRHRGEALLLVLATLGIVASLLLATALFTYATNPWQRVFTRSNGAHVWIHTVARADTSRLSTLEGVDAVAGPYATQSANLTAHGVRATVELRATPSLPSVSRPELTSGHWLRAGDPDGVVLETHLARVLLAGPGDTLVLSGAARTLTVLGIADSAEPHYRPGEQPGLVWALPAAVTAPDGQVTGLRLSDPDDTDYAVQRAVTLIGAGAVGEVSTWLQARGQARGESQLLGQALVVFGLAALLTACLAVHGAIATRIRGHLRDIAVLKAVGFTPGQVVRVFVFQHLAYAVLGAALAAALVQSLGSHVPGRLGEAVSIWHGLPQHAQSLLAVPAGTVLFIGATTALAAWRAGRVPPVPADGGGNTGRGLSVLARGVLRVGTPPALVLGLHRIAARRSRSAADVARLSLPMLLIVVASCAWSTIGDLRAHPEHAGLPAALTVHCDGLDDNAVRALLRADPGVAAVYPGAEVTALVPGQTSSIELRGIGSRDVPYPYALVAGRTPRGLDEAVAGQGLLDLLHAGVGDWIRVTVGARPQVLHIVGRVVETENEGRVLSTSLEDLRANEPGLGASVYALRLRPHAHSSAVIARLSASSHGRFEIYAVPNPAAGLSPLRGVIAGAVAVLAFIGLVELLTAIGATVREQERNLLALTAIGLTPRQIVALTMSSVTLTAFLASLIGLSAGLPLGRWLIDVQGRSSGVGSGLARHPSPVLLAALGASAVVGAAVLAVLPAERAVRRRRPEAIGPVV
ncbi:FtsX-like permease family protein [Streptomyces sp. NPDC006654]|uniref:ABC transporter permease n=1 Tax=Streptomyces sp. NPDC006654 TaxID=3156897 RepID=UPI0033C14D70